MLWINAAIASTAILAVVSVIDSHLVSKRVPSVRSFLLPAGILNLIFGVAALGIFSFPDEVHTITIAVASASGVARAVGVVIMLRIMRSEEVSRIIPVVHTFPIFVAFLAVPLLGEVLEPLKWLGIFITVGGAVLISVRWNTERGKARLGKSFVLLMASSLLLGIANTASKYALEHISFWNMYAISSICLGATFFLLSVRPGTWLELSGMRQRSRVLALITLNEFIVIAGVVLSFWAIEQGPVSLVSTILGARPFFVFIFALALSRVFPMVLRERFSRSVVVTKVISIGLIIGGVTLLTLNG